MNILAMSINGYLYVFFNKTVNEKVRWLFLTDYLCILIFFADLWELILSCTHTITSSGTSHDGLYEDSEIERDCRA